jgi:hypothetical protein
MSAGKARSLPKNGATERCFTGVGLGLTRIFTGKAVTVTTERCFTGVGLGLTRIFTGKAVTVTTGRILISMYSRPVCIVDEMTLVVMGRPIAASTNGRFDQLPLHRKY